VARRGIDPPAAAIIANQRQGDRVLTVRILRAGTGDLTGHRVRDIDLDVVGDEAGGWTW